ncbi:hypothetical protein [Aureimonas leprariae]|uniref:Uncharacterized protein n=1 Tax=Plantimonas leprariae TaxID=2615207 RepID=A0A7V7PL72_9HYPH|nr:hypothetical protein [Aureimonas leprariae]KAB0676706.1 hypothetical protein F6X38_20615 [Aureimonas leprariae]
MPPASKPIGRSKPQARAKISNKFGLLPDVDGRSLIMRRYKDILAQLVVDIGGDPSEAQTIIARRACTIAVWCEQAEASMANGNGIDIGEFTTATNALRRLLSDLGLERRAKNVTPDVRGYMELRAAEKAAGVAR